MNFLKEYISALISLTNEMSPYLLLGFFFAGILHVFFPDDKINRLLGANNFKSVFKAALIGIPLPLCSCGVIPTGISFFRQGASKGSTVSFLISTPQTGVDSIMVTYSLIGLPFAIIRVIVALITGLLGGLLTNFVTKNHTEKTTNQSNNAAGQKNITYSITEIFRYAFFDFIKDIAKWLIIGLLIAALITVLIPQEFFTQYLDNNILSMLIILVASVPLYVCATGSVPIAAALIMKGISPGAALVFLMAGPATNAATITVISKVLGKRTLFSYLFSIISGALIFGIIIDYILPQNLFTGFLENNNMYLHKHEFLPLWFKITSSVLLIFFLINSLLSRYFKKIKKHNTSQQFDFQNLKLIEGMENIVVSVKGMDCNHCKMTVENGLKQIPEIKEVNANFETDSVTISGDNINLEKVKESIESLGYKFEGKIN